MLELQAFLHCSYHPRSLGKVIGFKITSATCFGRKDLTGMDARQCLHNSVDSLTSDSRSPQSRVKSLTARRYPRTHWCWSQWISTVPTDGNADPFEATAYREKPQPENRRPPCENKQPAW